MWVENTTIEDGWWVSIQPTTRWKDGGSVLHLDVLSLYQRIFTQPLRVQIHMMHVHTADLTVTIRSVVIDSVVKVAARCILGHLIPTMTQVTTSPDLFDRIHDVEELGQFTALITVGH